MSKFKVEFTLKQHTPIIHFQSDQSGATLRASELKPKFDRFLIDYIFKKDKSQYESFLIDKDKDALNYKVKIPHYETLIEPIEYHAKDGKGNLKYDRKTNKPSMSALPTFFANMGEKWNGKTTQLSWASQADNIKIEFISFHTKLTDIIVQNFEEFIFITNFGMRQSKGFGSYEVIQCDHKSFIKELDVTSFTKVEYKFNINLDEQAFSGLTFPNVNYPSKSFKILGKLFEIINTFSKTYRSGINFGGYYFKSLMYEYAMTQNPKWTWDKKYFKSKFLGDNHPKIKEQRSKHLNPDILNFTHLQNPYLLRDLLGLATTQAWLSYNNKTISHKESNEIKRYKSPITFKIISHSEKNFTVYLIVSDSLLSKKKYEFELTDGSKDIKIETPDTFNIHNYLKWCFEFDVDNHAVKYEKDKNPKVKIDHLKDKYHKAINHIYIQLKPQAQTKVIQ